jgi:hypothetical protein
MVQSLTLPSPGKAVVLFDSYYLCPTVAQACAARGFHYVGVAKKNRNSILFGTIIAQFCWEANWNGRRERLAGRGRGRARSRENEAV